MTDREKTQLLVMATALCFIFAGDRLFRFQYEHVPVAKVGDCIRIQVPSGGVRDYVILQNDSEIGYSTIRSKSYPFSLFDQVSYAQLKDAGAKKVECYETNR